MKIRASYSLACVVNGLAAIITIEEFSMKQLNSNDGKDEMKQYVHNQYVDYVLQRIHHTVEHRFEFGYALDGFQWPQYSQHPE